MKVKYNSLNQIVRSTNTKYLLKRRHKAFRKTNLHYQVIIISKFTKFSELIEEKYVYNIVKLRNLMKYCVIVAVFYFNDKTFQRFNTNKVF